MEEEIWNMPTKRLNVEAIIDKFRADVWLGTGKTALEGCKAFQVFYQTYYYRAISRSW